MEWTSERSEIGRERMTQGAVMLIARREITSRLQQRGYRIGFGIALLVVIAVCVIPSFFAGDDGPTSYDVGVGIDAPGLQAALTTTGKAAGAAVTVHDATAATARAKVRSGDWDAAVLPGGTLLAKERTGGVVTLVQNSYRLAQTLGRLQNAGLTPAQSQRALQVSPLRVSATASSQDTQRQTIAIISVIVLFSQLITFCTWVATGVVEEKASRVVELILSSVRPVQLLAGKLLGIGVLAAAQTLAIGVVALVAGAGSGTLTLPASGIATVAVTFVGFLLGFLFFAALAAALASTVSRQEEVSGILTPVTLSITACYGLAFATGSDPGGALARVLSIVPPLSALSMPARIAHGGVAVFDVVLAVVLLLLAAVGVVVIAARVYRASVLHSGTRVPLRRAWRGEAVAELS